MVNQEATQTKETEDLADELSDEALDRQEGSGPHVWISMKCARCNSVVG